MSNDRQEEQAFLQQLRVSSEPGAAQEAVQLQTLFHDRQMGNLAADVSDEASKKCGVNSSHGDRRIAHA